MCQIWWKRLPAWSEWVRRWFDTRTVCPSYWRGETHRGVVWWRTVLGTAHRHQGEDVVWRYLSRYFLMGKMLIWKTWLRFDRYWFLAQLVHSVYIHLWCLALDIIKYLLLKLLFIAFYVLQCTASFVLLSVYCLLFISCLLPVWQIKELCLFYRGRVEASEWGIGRQQLRSHRLQLRPVGQCRWVWKWTVYRCLTWLLVTSVVVTITV